MGWMDFLGRLLRATGLTDRQVASLEKRSTFRVARRISLLGTRAEGETVPLVATNLGAWGLRVESPVRLRKDEVLTLHRARQPEEGAAQAASSSPIVRVVWSRRRKAGASHETGLVFVTDTETRRRAAASFLVDDCRVGIRDPRENRRAPRVAAEMRGSVMTPDCRIYDVVLRDIAVGGVLASSSRAIERNVEVDLKVALPQVPQPLVCRGTVVRCTRRGSQYELGVAFTSISDANREVLVGYLSRQLSS